MGEIVVAANPLEGQTVRLRIVATHFVDPKGERLRA
jgi:sarcosine oxidase subunit alpha